MEQYTYNDVTQWVRNSVYDDDRISMGEVRTYDLGSEPIETAVDIGAHIGSFVRYLKHLYPQVAMLAYEPEAGNFEVLAANCATLTDAVPIHAPVGYYGGQSMSVVIHPSHSTCHYLVPTAQFSKEVKQLCPAPVSLEQVLDEFELHFHTREVDLLKIDAEGAELDIFEHCTDESILAFRRICGEFHNGYEKFVSTIGLRLADLKYDVWGEQDIHAHSTFVAVKR